MIDYFLNEVIVTSQFVVSVVDIESEIWGP